MENTIEILKNQHVQLKKQLTDTDTETKAENPNGVNIVKNLNEFSILLKEHLVLEDGAFYPQVLEKMRNKNMPTADTEEFIKHMGVIAKDVYAFLDTYKEPTVIESNISGFKSDLEQITAALILRVTSEEDGVYLYWSL